MVTLADSTHTTRRKALVADALLLSVAVFWGSNFVFIKSAVQRTSALAGGSIVAGTMLYLLLRYLVATGIFAAAQPRSWLRAARRDWAMGALLAAFYLTALILQTVGPQRTSPGVSGFITGMSVAMVPFLYWFVARRSPGRWQIVGAVVAFIGLAALSLRGNFTLTWGDSITLLGTLFYALHIMTTGFYAPRVRPATLAVTQMAVSTGQLWWSSRRWWCTSPSTWAGRCGRPWCGRRSAAPSTPSSSRAGRSSTPRPRTPRSCWASRACSPPSPGWSPA